MSYVTHTIIDHSAERSFTRHFLPAITDANHDAIAGNAVGQNVGDLRLALADMTDGNFVKHEVTAVTARDGVVVATNPNAQREIKLLVRAIESTSNIRVNFEIPCPNLTVLAQPGTDLIDTTAQEWIDFVTAFNVVVRGPNEQPLSIIDGRIVGRRL